MYIALMKSFFFFDYTAVTLPPINPFTYISLQSINYLLCLEFIMLPYY